MIICMGIGDYRFPYTFWQFFYESIHKKNFGGGEMSVAVRWVKGIRLLFTKGPVVFGQRVIVYGRRSLTDWKLKRFLRTDERELELQRTCVFSRTPVVSILTPLYNTPEAFLREMIESVMKQTYPCWQLCLVDGSDKDHSYVGKVCDKYAGTDFRIRYHKLEENRGISENTNECIQISSGEFLGLLDHDDVLHPSALFEVVSAINKNNADFIYTDEVKFSNDIGKPYDPAFKPGFSQEELRTLNYICHFTVFSRRLIEQAGSFDSAFDGSQDHDLVLRLTEKAESIVHIPKILYYWRVHKESVAYSIEAKQYAVKAAQNAILSQLKRCHEKGMVESTELFPTVYHVKYELIEKPLISIIISGNDCNQRAKCRQLLERIVSYDPYETICLDKPLPDCNAEIKKLAKGKCFLLLDSSLSAMGEDSIQEMLMLLQNPKIKLVGGMAVSHKKRLLYAGITHTHFADRPLLYWHEGMPTDMIKDKMELHHVRSTTALWEGFMMLRADDWEKAGGFSNLAPGYLGIDLCLRLKDEGEILWTPYANAVFEIDRISQNQKNDSFRSFYNRWSALFQQPDPHSNPNLEKFNLKSL